MSAPLRRGRALLRSLLRTHSSHPSNLLGDECLKNNASAFDKIADNQLARPTSLLRYLSHTLRTSAAGGVEDMSAQAGKDISDEDTLQMRSISGSSANTSSSCTLLPAAAIGHSSRRHFFSSRSTDSAEDSAGGSEQKSTRSRKQRFGESKSQRYGRSSDGSEKNLTSMATSEGLSESETPDAGSALVSSRRRSASAADGHSECSSASHMTDAASRDAADSKRTAPVQQNNHTARHSRSWDPPPEAKVSKKTRKLEAMAPEMLQEDESSSQQKAASANQKPAKRHKLPGYERIDAQAAAFMKGNEDKFPLEIAEKDRIWQHLDKFSKSAKMRDAALALYVNAKLFPIAAQDFRSWILRGVDEQLRDALMAAEPGEVNLGLFNLFARYVLANFSDQIKIYSEAIKTLDLRKPHLWYPMARSLKRKLVYHMGPTNSGKTYNALLAMRSAESGVYCGPLRLLAMEVYDELNALGTHCNLTTGQERRILPTAQHTACTIEMINLRKRVDVAVIDEIQLIGDEQRGWAWTRTLQGVPANEIHLCGDGSALPLVKRLAAEMNEPLEVNEYQRFTPLMVESQGLARGYLDVQPGDCVVAFSRKDIYDIKQLIEAGTGQRVCVVYGALPPEMRRTQALLFNDPDSGYDVLVASDAVGMGLNLNIRRIIFHTMSKFQDGIRAPISISQIKQIGGRAGRRNSQFGQGLVTCLNASDTERLQQALDAPLDAMTTDTAGLFPEFEQLEAFAGSQLEDSFYSILTRSAAEAQIDGTYMFCKQDSVLQGARFLADVSDLSLQERYWFCMAPANLRNAVSSAALMRFAKKYVAREPVEADISFEEKIPATSEEMCELEAVHQDISLWIWLSYRFPEEYFPGRDSAEALSERVIECMSDGLERMFGPTAAIVSPKARKAAAEKLATWTNGAKDASEMAELVSASGGAPDVRLPPIWDSHKIQRSTQLEVA